jgi:NTE family protein
MCGLCSTPGGYKGFELQKIAMQLDEAQVSDWSLSDRGLIKGEALQGFINKVLQGRTLEKLNRPVGVVATDLNSGESVVFRTGDAGTAVRASSSVPGVFQPVGINGREYVDGGLTSPIPVRAARAMGADVIIAVDISSRPALGKTRSTLDVMLQTFSIMGQSISRHELVDASVVIRPAIHEMSATDFQTRHLAVLEGEKAAAAVMPQIKAKIQKLRGG